MISSVLDQQLKCVFLQLLKFGFLGISSSALLL